MRVDLVTRSGCHLCDEAARLLAQAGHQVNFLTVDDDPELFRLYDFRVPVVLVQGQVIAEGKFSAADLAALQP